MAFNRDDGKPSLCVMIKGSDGYKNYKLNKSEKYYDVTIQYKDLVEELLKINNDIETLRSDINDEKNEDKSQTKKEKLKALEDIKVLIEKKYTEQQIENLKSMKENEIQILDKKIKLIEKYEKNEKN
jgi:septal ring factor EnvC (AmiA/AmiB activator)